MYQPDIQYVNDMIRKLSFPRVSSSEGEDRAFGIVEGELKKLDLHFEYQPFDAPWRGPYESYIVRGEKAYPAVSTMAYNFMNLDWGYADSYDTDITGLISNDKTKKAIRYCESITPEEISSDKEATAFIVRHCDDHDALACAQLSLYNYIPCLCLHSGCDAQFAEGENIRLCIKTRVITRKCRNLVIKPDGESPTPMIVGAHVDTFAGTPGASDDACGVAVGLDIIRQCRNEDVWVVLFTGEEIDRRGAVHFVREYLRDRNLRPSVYMNIDSGVEKGSPEIQITITPKVLRDRLSHLYEGRYNIGDNVFSSNDAQAFHEEGIPVFWAWASSPYKSHLPLDTPDNIDQTQLKKIMGNYALAINTLLSE